jgi:DNA polymerase IV (DinB-like DNA polymerase)
MERIILHIDLDSFYASLEELRHEEIRGKPVVICVFSGRSEDSGAVSTANYKARELGIKSGMPISLAKRIAKDKDVVFLPNDIEYYRKVSDRIMEILEEEADIFQQVSIDEAYLDVTKRSMKSWNNAKKIAERIKERIKEQEDLTCSIGVGSNKLVAKMASKHKKPDGLTIIKDTEVKKFFENLPVSKIHGIGGKTTKILDELGIKTSKELADFDINILEERFGENKAKLLVEKARGIDDSPVEQKERQQISRLATLKEDTNDIETIFERIKELATDMKKKIEKGEVSFRTVSIILIDTVLKTQTRNETIQLTNDLNSALPTIKSLLDNFLKENSDKKLRRVGIRVSNLVYKKEQKTLGDF